MLLTKYVRTFFFDLTAILANPVSHLRSKWLLL